jgi:hypothetical protein
MKRHLLTFIWILIFFLGLGSIPVHGGDKEKPAILPAKVALLQSLIQGMSKEGARLSTYAVLGLPARDVGSGLSIEQWDIDGGVFTFHPYSGPTYRDAAGKITWLIFTRNELAANLIDSYEVTSRKEQDPYKKGNGFWLGNIRLNSSGHYKYKDSGSSYEERKVFPRHFFEDHPKGTFHIVYSKGMKPTDALEDIPDDMEVCKIRFISGGTEKTFGIVNSRSDRRLRFTSDGQVFEADRGWNKYWPEPIE